MVRKLEPKEVVQKQLESKREEHVKHLMVALGKSHPDLATVALHDGHIQRIDRALEYLKQYPPAGYEPEPAPEPKRPKITIPKPKLPKVTLRKPKPAATPDEPAKTE